MYKKIAVMLFLVAMVFAPVSEVYAKPKGDVILIRDLHYIASSTQTVGGNNDGFMAEGEGWIDCNGVSACEDAGLHGQTATVKQMFGVQVDGIDYGNFKARTAGVLQLPGEYPPIRFKGKGRGTAECDGDVCHLTITFKTNIKGGGKLFCRLDIDHTSAGFASQFTGAIIAMQRESK